MHTFPSEMDIQQPTEKPVQLFEGKADTFHIASEKWREIEWKRAYAINKCI